MTGKLIASLNAELTGMIQEGYSKANRRIERLTRALEYLRSRTR